MEKKDIVDQFVLSRPDAVGVYGYGSGVFKQESYSDQLHSLLKEPYGFLCL